MELDKKEIDGLQDFADEVHLKERQTALRKSGTLKLQGKDYLQVAHRVAIMRAEHPDWGVETGYSTYQFEDKPVLVARCAVLDGTGKLLANATKMVVRPSGKSAASKYPMETAETGAIGRALAACGYGTLSGDLDEGDQIADAPQKGTW